MTQLTPHSSDDEPERSPFDPLRHFDERGEYWWASEICEPLGYTWRRFPDVIERARLALQANGDDPDVHIVPKTGLSTDALGNPGREWRLTRYGAYTVVQGGDPSKLPIARGWAYFRTKTREAETGMVLPVQLDPALQRIVDLTVQMQITKNEQERLSRRQDQQAAEIAAVANDVASLMEMSPLADTANLLTLRDVAHQCGTGQNRLSAWLKSCGILFEDHQGHWRVQQHPWVESGWAVDRWERWRNGMGWAWVTYFTPVGALEIRRRWSNR